MASVADDAKSLMCRYGSHNPRVVTGLEGIQNLLGEDVKVSYAKGCNVRDRHFPESDIMYFEMSEKEKDNAIKKFKEDKNIRLFIGNLGSASTGLDGLHEKTNTCVYVELPYLWSEVQQASGRVRRANSTYSNYFSYFRSYRFKFLS